MSVKIYSNDYIYTFKELIVYEHYGESIESCYFCGRRVSIIYSAIIKKLKYEGILDEDYRMRCCACDFILNHNEKSIHCDNCGDVLWVEVNIEKRTYSILCGKCNYPNPIKKGFLDIDRKAR